MPCVLRAHNGGACGIASATGVYVADQTALQVPNNRPLLFTAAGRELAGWDHPSLFMVVGSRIFECTMAAAVSLFRSACCGGIRGLEHAAALPNLIQTTRQTGYVEWMRRGPHGHGARKHATECDRRGSPGRDSLDAPPPPPGLGWGKGGGGVETTDLPTVVAGPRGTEARSSHCSDRPKCQELANTTTPWRLRITLA